MIAERSFQRLNTARLVEKVMEGKRYRNGKEIIGSIGVKTRAAFFFSNGP